VTDLGIETTNLTKKYSRQLAVDRFDMRVPSGSIYGLLGRNGAGKTTTIKMLLGLLPITSGSATVLHHDSQRESIKIKAEVGYVPEIQKMYDWMTIAEIVDFTSVFYPTWNKDEAERLLNQFRLDRNKKIGELSRGMTAQVSLVLALAYEPKLLILDDPTSGLDPIVRKDFLSSISELAQKEGRTIFFSSHILGDIERICDWVGIVSHGRMRKEARVDDLKSSVKKIIVKFEEVPPETALPGVINQERNNSTYSFTVENYSDETLSVLKKYRTRSVEVVDLNLEEIFVEYLGKESA